MSSNQCNLNNHANQCNPNNGNYQGYSSGYSGSRATANLNNHANQCNPNNRAYASSRGGSSSGAAPSGRKMRSIAFIAASVLLLAIQASAATVSETCAKATTIAHCAQKAQLSYSCVWLEGQCVRDPCTAADNNKTECLEWASTDRKCLYMPGAETYKCVNYKFLCNRIPLGTCPNTGYCAVKSESYCDYAIPDGSGSTGDATAECTAFPIWSIALLILWLFIMLILIAIIVLAMKRKNSAISGVESSTVNVDNVAVRDDHFAPSGGLDQPLVR